MSVTYLIRTTDSGAYEVTKWEEWGGKRPDAVYRVELNKWEERECNCIGSQVYGYCKHSVMVRVWLKDGKPLAIPIVVGLGPWGWGL